MLGRELAIALRAPITWFTAAAAMLLVGHGYVLAIDLYTAGSRSALNNVLMSREFDPLLGIVRPTLGGLNLALSMFGPLIGARLVAVEKERRTFHGALLARGSIVSFVASKWIASVLAALLPWLGVWILLLAWIGLGGHLAWSETVLAASGQLLYAALTTAIGVAAAAFTASVAQATALGLLTVAGSWAVDAADGFSALAWLGGAQAWSPATYLAPLEQATLQVSSLGWYAAAVIGLFSLACVGCRFDLHGYRKVGLATVVAVALIASCALVRSIPQAWDVSEAKRHSLPPAAAAKLTELPGALRMRVHLDREDSRRRQLEGDTLAKLRLARPDLHVRFPTDDMSERALLEQDTDYGTIAIQLGDRTATTTSTSRRELTTLIFELAGKKLPDWTPFAYPGYPLVVEGFHRTLAAVVSYALLPGLPALLGLLLARARRE
jgi:hypothetical protein